MKTLSVIFLASTMAFTAPAYARHHENVLGGIFGQILDGIARQVVEEPYAEYQPIPVYAPADDSYARMELAQMHASLRVRMGHPSSLRVLSMQAHVGVNLAGNFDGHVICGTFSGLDDSGETVGPVQFYTVTGEAVWPKAAVADIATKMCKGAGF